MREDGENYIIFVRVNSITMYFRHIFRGIAAASLFIILACRPENKTVIRYLQVPVVAGQDVPVARILPAEGGRRIPRLRTAIDGLPQGTRYQSFIRDSLVYVNIDGGTVDEASVTFDVVVRGRGIELRGDATHRLARKVRTSGDDGSKAYRIPGLVTTAKGTLVACYDIRRQGYRDLQGDIDIGVSRSEDGGRSWGEMIVAMDMGEWGGLPQDQNGIGDPCILLDEVTGDMLLFAVWAHGEFEGYASSSSGDGFEPWETPQLMMSRSTDDGLSWSEPVNLTCQVKRREWHITLQGPGRGITMSDGTLVVPMQFQDAERKYHSAIMYSRDRGNTWHCDGWSAEDNNEAQVVELQDGSLMLNMRNLRKLGRSVALSRDMGRTWEPHVATGMLDEPVCQASLIKIPRESSPLSRELLLFSNPWHPRDRRNMSVRMSFNEGYSWPCRVLLDEQEGLGYSCLTMVDEQTVGILYESSQADLVFQTLKISELYDGPSFNHIVIPVVTDKDVPIAEFIVPDGDTLPSYQLRLKGIPQQALRNTYARNGRVYINIDGSMVGETSPVFEVQAIGEGFRVTGSPLHRIARKIRDRGDDGAAQYRIPGIVTTHKGTLVASYDVRWLNGKDQPNDISTAISRSLDGGRSWEPMQIVMDKGEWGGLPRTVNGVSDPAILIDDNTGELFLFASWVHGGTPGVAVKYTDRGRGWTPEETGQLMVSRSVDDGVSWSEPVSITPQIKDYDWRGASAGPGRGITMADGTLVMPLQFRNEDNICSSTIIYSRDHGQTWVRGKGHIKLNVNECQVAEIEPGVLMINSRDRSISGRRAVYTTSDMGDSWTRHPTDGLALVECFCQAALYKVAAEDNCLGRDILLFSNCAHNPRQRRNLTIRMSLDKGMTWPGELLLDYYHGMGYSCMTMLDKETLGIIFESSQGSEVFQAIPLREIYETCR